MRLKNRDETRQKTRLFIDELIEVSRNGKVNSQNAKIINPIKHFPQKREEVWQLPNEVWKPFGQINALFDG